MKQQINEAVRLKQLAGILSEMPLGAEAGVTDEHQAILQAIQDMVMAGDHKILDLIKDKMQAEWGDDTITEASNQMTPETRAALSSVTMLSAPEVEDFLIGLVKYFNYVSSGDEDENELPNIDVKALTHHLSQAASVLAGRTGN